MVAMLGWIIPAPLQTPEMVTVSRPDRNDEDAIFGRVSVVMMARAKDSKAGASDERERASAGTAVQIVSTGRGTPMIPVEDGNTKSAAASSCVPSSAQIARASARPRGPVAQLAFPLLTNTARMRPAVFFRCS